MATRQLNGSAVPHAEEVNPTERTEICIGGRSAEKRRALRWVIRQPNGTPVIRVFGYVVTKVLRRAADMVTFDRSSFESALARIPEGTLVVIAPTHRSYMDFLLCSYLFFDQPQLGVAIPHIAAAEEFSRIPLLGWLFRKANAFFIKRGMRRQDYIDLKERVEKLVKRRETLQVFIEGTRSRARQFLPPKHGVLKCLQETGQAVTILPIAISYDRVSEEASFLLELGGRPKPKMRLRTLTRWTTRLLRGKIKIGHIHIACGAPVMLDEFSRLREVAEAVIGQLQARTVATTLHLKSFLALNAIDGDLQWLSEVLEARGGPVLKSKLDSRPETNPLLERCMRYHWIHLFYPEARALFPENPAIQHHVSFNGYLQNPTLSELPDHDDPRVGQLLRALFEPICYDYVAVSKSLGNPGDSLDGINPLCFLRSHPSSFLPDIEGAFDAMVKRQILAHGKEPGSYRWGRCAAEIGAFSRACVFSDASTSQTADLQEANAADSHA